MTTGKSTRINPFGFVTDLWRHRDLLRQFTMRNFQLTLRGSHLGLVWSFLNPLLVLGLYVFVFGFIFGGHFGVVPNETKWDYALGMLIALTLFNLLAEVIAVAPTIITASPNFVKKVVFPLEILPAAAVGASILRMFISMFLVLIGIAFLGHGLTVGLLWLPVILLPILLFSVGCAWLISALGVFIQDIAQLVPFVSTALMYASAVFYSAKSVPAAAWVVLRFNPLLQAIELARKTALWRMPIEWGPLLYLYAASIGFCLVGYTSFRKLKPMFADVV